MVAANIVEETSPVWTGESPSLQDILSRVHAQPSDCFLHTSAQPSTLKYNTLQLAIYTHGPMCSCFLAFMVLCIVTFTFGVNTCLKHPF